MYALTRQKAYVSLYRQQHGLFRHWIGQLRQLGGPEYAGNVADQALFAQAWFAIADRIAAASGGAVSDALIKDASPPSVAFYADNEGLAQRLAVRGRQLVADSEQSLTTGLVWGGSLLLLAIGLALASSLRTIHTVTSPLYDLTSTLGRLTAGEYRARAEVAGPSEVRAVARSVNTLADESDRLRRVDEQYSRLRAMARDAGNRIREYLNPEDVVREAHTAIQDQLDCDVVLLLLPIEGQAGDHKPQWVPGGGSSPVMPPDVTEWIGQMAERRASLVIQDLGQLTDDAVLPRIVREGLHGYGVVTGMIVPLASGPDLLGVVSGWRTHGTAWTPAETDAFESIAGDVTRALRHARLYEAENRLIADLKALARTRSDFLATVSHDLRTPLTSIIGFLELLRDGAEGPVTSGQARMFETIDRNAMVLQNLIENVLAISTIESGDQARGIPG